MKKINIIIGAIWALGAGACNYLDVKPYGQVLPEKVTEYRALLVKGYDSFQALSHKQIVTVRADEVFPYAGKSAYEPYLSVALWNEYNPGTYTPAYPWQGFYNAIFYANSILENVDEASVDTREDSREQLKAEAYLLRAYAHFELLNLYGKPYVAATAATDRGIPIALKIDIEQDYVPETVEQVYEQILADIREARVLMQVEEQPAETRYRFSKRSALAFEARVRLYRSEWEQALALAEELLPCELEDFNADAVTVPWDYSSKEAILSLEKVANNDMLGGKMYVLPGLMDKYEKTGDLRVDMYFRKQGEDYLPDKGYSDNLRVSFRSAEVYLIAAEAAAHIEGKLTVARDYLRQLMVKRLTPAYYRERVAAISNMDREQLIAEIADERARELALEGHRWYDLRRSNRPKITKVYTDPEGRQQTAVLQADDARYTIRFPQEAVAANPELNN